MSDKLIEIVNITARIIERIIDKITSGRFVFTVFGAYLFYKASMVGIIKPDDVTDILKNIVIFYFVVKQLINQGDT